MSTPITFLLPLGERAFSGLPTRIEDYWDWQTGAQEIVAYWGQYHWVLQTWLYLKGAGMDVRIAREIPDEGILITHMDCLDYGFRPGRRLTVVVMLVDREVPHPHAALHVTHNPVQRLPYGLAHHYMPPWPQVGLVGRTAERGERFERVGYFGYSHNLTPELNNDEFRVQLARLGLELFIPDPNGWHDFSQVDCILAVRSMGRADPHLNKPALKLFNAWAAGVPAILGYETAYRVEGTLGEDYLEATSADAVVAALTELTQDAARRKAIVERGHRKLAAVTPERTVERWRQLLEGPVRAQHAARLASPWPLMKDRARGAVLERLLWRRPNDFRIASVPELD